MSPDEAGQIVLCVLVRVRIVLIELWRRIAVEGSRSLKSGLWYEGTQHLRKPPAGFLQVSNRHPGSVGSNSHALCLYSSPPYGIGLLPHLGGVEVYLVDEVSLVGHGGAPLEIGIHTL